jgi:hypothetical protein
LIRVPPGARVLAKDMHKNIISVGLLELHVVSPNAIRGTTDIAWQRRQEIIGHGSGAVSRTADCDIAVAWVTDRVVQIAASGVPPCR